MSELNCKQDAVVAAKAALSRETVTITKNKYEQLLRDQYWLSCLEIAGVDNWQGVEIAIDIFKESKYADIE